MARSYPLFQIDSFTNICYHGNPAGVVLDAEGLTDHEMQLIAREMNNSETAFVFKGNISDYDYCVRFFTPSTEVPSCGHATIAANFVLAKNHGVKGIFRQKTRAGVLIIENLIENETIKVYMTQRTPQFLSILNKQECDSLYRALGISQKEVLEAAPIQVVDTGHSKVIIPLVDRHH